jgi:putative MATE family efflux protein
MTRGATLTHGPVGAHLKALAGPMAFGILAIMAFNLVDTWYVSLLGTTELAAMSLTFPVVAVVGSVGMGLGIGATSVISRTIGGGDMDQVRRLTTDALILAGLVVVVVCVAGYLAIDPLFRMLGADAEVLPLVRAYMQVWFLGSGVLIVPMMGLSAIRATGDTRTPAKVMTFAGVANGVLDPIFIFGWGPIPAMGLEGAALATVLSRTSTLVVTLYVLGARERIITRRFDGLAATLSSWRRILTIGGPAAATNLTQPLTIGLLTALVASEGQAAVAAFGAGGRVEMFALIPIMGLGAGITPFVGQNWGAGLRDRVGRALGLAIRADLALGLMGWTVLFLAARPLAGLFSQDPEVTALITTYLRILPLGHAFIGIFQAANSTFNAVGRPLTATALTLLRAPLLTAGLAFAGGALFGLPGVFWGAALAAVASGVIALIWLTPLLRPSSAALVPAPTEA